MRKSYLLYLIYSLLIFYLLVNTGIISDDFDIMARIKGKKFVEVFNPKAIAGFIETPVEFFTHYIGYYFFRIDNSITNSFFKILYILLSFYLISKFFQIYLEKETALWASFLFIFFPAHDATAYWFMAQYLTLSFAFYLYSFYLAHHNRLALAFLLALIASFLSYGTTPIAVSLFILFALNKEFKKGFVILIPNIIYILYFIPLNIVLRLGAPRIIEKISIYGIIRKFVLQILTFVDSMLGPSMWLKIYYSFSQLSIPSIVIGIFIIIIFYRKYQAGAKRYNVKLIFCLIILTFLSLAMFAVTGRYPQLAFNLGNRTTIFGSLLFTYIIVLMPASHKLRTLVFGLMIFTILGISDHWKSWNIHQQRVIANIRNNQDLKNYQDKKVIYVSGNQYSKFGPISHIEFLSQPWVTSSVLYMLFGRIMQIESIDKSYRYLDGYLKDKKNNLKIKVKDYINIYDSERNVLLRLEAKEINNYIDALARDNRHWVQMLNIKFLNDIITRLSPRLKYALPQLRTRVNLVDECEKNASSGFHNMGKPASVGIGRR